MWARLQRQKQTLRNRLHAVLWLSCLLTFASPGVASAITPLPIPPPGVGSYGLEATKLQPPPTTSATIVTPNDGASFTDSPITVSGLCTTDLIVQIYDNGVLVGAIDCVNGSFSIQVSLFTGKNDLTTIQFDDLGQAGPQGNTVSVTYNNANFQAFGTLITLTSNYGRRAANPGQTLTWPLLLSGGTGPYAFSINWGDGSALDLKSVALAGEVDFSHVYDKSGIYHVTFKVTDVNGVSAFLQVVAVANGKPEQTTGETKKTIVTITKILWWPAVICLILLPAAYWLGRRSQLVSLHKKLERDIANYKEL